MVINFKDKTYNINLLPYAIAFAVVITIISLFKDTTVQDNIEAIKEEEKNIVMINRQIENLKQSFSGSVSRIKTSQEKLKEYNIYYLSKYVTDRNK